jgi:alpha-tubulin suppressor-like RCC1 family protein
MRWLTLSLLLVCGCGARSELEVGGGTGGSAVVALSLGWTHSCALLRSGAAACWGSDAEGELGDGRTTTAVPTPQALPIAGAIAALGAGQEQTCAAQRDGTLLCWGENFLDQLGTGGAGPITSPAVVGAGFAGVSAGFDYACGVRTDGTVACWGSGAAGNLGNGDGSSFVESTPTTVQGETGAAVVRASGNATCALQDDGSVHCWGNAALGCSACPAISTAPLKVVGLDAPVQQIAVGSVHACALLEGGQVSCWGVGVNGQLGLGPSVMTAAVPQAIPGLTAMAISAGASHTCAVLTDGTAQCWGYADVSDPSFAPVTVPGLTSAIAIASGESHDCAVLSGGGGVVCWGSNGFGQLGDGTTTDSSTPVSVVGLPGGG